MSLYRYGLWPNVLWGKTRSSSCMYPWCRTLPLAVEREFGDQRRQMLQRCRNGRGRWCDHRRLLQWCRRESCTAPSPSNDEIPDATVIMMKYLMLPWWWWNTWCYRDDDEIPVMMMKYLMLRWWWWNTWCYGDDDEIPDATVMMMKYLMLPW